MRIIFAVLFVLRMSRAESEPNEYDPELVDEKGDLVNTYIGSISNLDDSDVPLEPALRARDRDVLGGARYICGYSLTGSDDIPFEVLLNDRSTGSAKLVFKNGVPIKFFKGEQYKFNISAFDCGSPLHHSRGSRVVITVTRGLLEDEGVLRNGEEATDKPLTGDLVYFDQASYAATVREGTMYDRIINMRPNAVDGSSGRQLANVCSYDLLTTDAPFTIDHLGNIKNTQVLSYSRQRNYILEVVATSCTGERSDTVLVSIQVAELCTPHWSDIPTSAEFLTGSGVLNVLETAQLNLCENKCEMKKVTATVTLDDSKQADKVCEKDIYSINLQRKICGASSSSVDLLPSPSTGGSWTRNLPTEDGNDGEEVFAFDGKTVAVTVPKDRVNHTLSSHFTFSLWMKHEDHIDNSPKEQIVCSADGDAMNRQHYSLFVHNCRLIFLLRKEADDVESLMALFPAEWRWDIPHVCDGQWHHYALSVDYPQVRLYIDGSRVDTDPNSVDILDDWALHPAKNIHFTELTVGACWQGATHKMTEHFKGYLAGFSMLNEHTESDRVIKCLNTCGERLSFHAIDALQPGMSLAYNSGMSQVTIKGSTEEEVQKIIRLVGYENRRLHSIHGRRTLSLLTTVMCDGTDLRVPEKSIYVMVLESDDPKITITGITTKTRLPKEFARGVNVFSEILIESKKQQLIGGKDNGVDPVDVTDATITMIDKCQVRINKPMNSFNGETLQLPDALLDRYLLESSEADQGFDISSADLLSTYTTVLREVVYRNEKVDSDFPGRTFTISCSSLNGRFESNVFSLQLSILKEHSLVEPIRGGSIGLVKVAKNGVEDNFIKLDESEKDGEPAVASSSSTIMIVMIVVCTSFLLAIIVIAVIRIRRVNRRLTTSAVIVEEGPEMEWDNTTLNLTVNPLEEVVGVEKDDEDSDSEDECRSIKEKDAIESSEDEAETVKDRDLEWDNSTLSY